MYSVNQFGEQAAFSYPSPRKRVNTHVGTKQRKFYSWGVKTGCAAAGTSGTFGELAIRR